MEITFNAPKLTSYQREFLYNDQRYTVIESSTKAGKTFAMIWYIFEEAVTAINDGRMKHYLWVANSFKTAEIAYKRLKSNLLQYKEVFKFHDTNMTVSLPNLSVIEFKTAEKPDNLYGQDYYLVIMDEAGRCRPEAFHALRSTVTATQGKMKMIGNFISRSNWLHRWSRDHVKDPDLKYMKITAYDAVDEGLLALEEIEQARADLHPTIFNKLYLAEGGGDEHSFFDSESIEKMFTEVNKAETGVHRITCDPAALGADKAVIMCWNGWVCEEIVFIEKCELHVVTDKVLELKGKYNVNKSNICVNWDGLGQGMSFGLQGAVQFHNGGKTRGADGKKFGRLKDQCYFRLRDEINANRMRVKCDSATAGMITEELEVIALSQELDVTAFKVNSKENQKKKLGRSPDFADALMMRMYWSLGSGYGNYKVI